MSDLSELIQKYKDNPTDEIKDKLISLVIAQEDAKRHQENDTKWYCKFINSHVIYSPNNIIYLCRTPSENLRKLNKFPLF